MRTLRSNLLLVGLYGLIPSLSLAQSEPPGKQGPLAGPLGFLFEPNAGRAEARFDHLLRLPSGRAALGSAQIELCNPSLAATGGRLAIDLVGATPGVRPQGEGKIGSWSSYHGQDASRWTVAAPSPERLRYREVWPGIDVLYRAGSAGLRYDFELAPGADPSSVQLSFRGVHSASIAADGRLLLDTEFGPLELSTPRLYQPTGPVEVPVVGGFKILEQAGGQLLLGFEVGPYDRSLPLVIDPTFGWVQWIGGGGNDSFDAVASDGQGGWFAAASSDSGGFPFAFLAFPQLFKDNLFLFHLDADGVVLQSTEFFGSQEDSIGGLAYDGSRLVLCGDTNSDDLPLAGKPLQTQNFGSRDAFIAAFDASDLSLTWSTLLGGVGLEEASGVAIAANGDVVVTGWTVSFDFPSQGQFDNGLPGEDAFLARLTPEGNDFVWVGTYGGVAIDRAYDVAIDAAGTTWFVGETTISGATQAFVQGVTPAGDLLPQRLYGGSGDDSAHSIDFDGPDSYWLLGRTASADLPVVNAFQSTLGGNRDCFCLHQVGTQNPDFLTYLGGTGVEEPVRIKHAQGVLSDPNVYVLIRTGSGELPLVNANCPFWFSSPSGQTAGDSYLAGIETSGGFSLGYATYLPPGGGEYAKDMAIATGDKLLICGAVQVGDMQVTNPQVIGNGATFDNGFLFEVRNYVGGSAGVVSFGPKDLLPQANTPVLFYAFRSSGGGATDVDWLLYSLDSSSYLDNYGGTLHFESGEQVAVDSLTLPAGLLFGGSDLFIVLQQPTGAAELDPDLDSKRVVINPPSSGGGGGGSYEGSGSSNGACATTALAGQGNGIRGLDRLRLFRDRVLAKAPLGRQFTGWYYRVSEQFAPWAARHPQLVRLLGFPVRLALWVLGYLEWLALALGSGLALRASRGLVARAQRGASAVPAPSRAMHSASLAR